MRLPLSGVPPDRRRSLGALLAVVVLVSACGASKASPVPSQGPTPNASVSAAPVVTAAPSPTSAPSPSDARAGAPWALAGPMPARLRDPHAVLLGDDRVLLVGNDYDTDNIGAFLWDPASATWTSTSGLNAFRTAFAMVPLGDGRALVTGGLNLAGQSYSSTYVYDPGHESWSKAGLLGTARAMPTAALLRDGRVLVVGGYFALQPSYGFDTDPGIALAAYRPTPSGEGSLADIDPPIVGSALATAELFDPTTGKWSATGSLHYARAGATAVTLSDGRVLVVGSADPSFTGVTVDGHALDSAEVYDPGTGKFSLAGRLPRIDVQALEKQGAKDANPIPGDPDPSTSGTLVALDDGGAVLIGWQGWWKHVGDITRSFRFDAGTTSWKEIGHTYIFIGEPTRNALDTPGVRAMSGVMVARIPDGRVLVAGGTGANDYPRTGSNETHSSAVAELYDPNADTWSTLPPMPETRESGVAVGLKDGSMLLIGGSAESATLRFVPSR